jgi:hypothetical protein
LTSRKKCKVFLAEKKEQNELSIQTSEPCRKGKEVSMVLVRDSIAMVSLAVSGAAL